jgi:hypothetical protein
VGRALAPGKDDPFAADDNQIVTQVDVEGSRLVEFYLSERLEHSVKHQVILLLLLLLFRCITLRAPRCYAPLSGAV